MDDFAEPPPPLLNPSQAAAQNSAMQREHDSLDDFEHLEHLQEQSPPPPPKQPYQQQNPLLADLLAMDSPPPPNVLGHEADLLGMMGVSSMEPMHRGGGGIDALQSFLDTERDEMLVPAPAPAPAAAPAAAPAPVHHLDDPFADSREELSPAPSDDSLPDAIENYASPPSPAKPPPPPAKQEPPRPLTPPPQPPKQEPPPRQVTPPPPKREETPPPPPPKRAASQQQPPKQEKQEKRLEAEQIFCQMGLDAWFNPGRLHPKVESLVYWRSPVRSGIALGAGLALLLALACCSLISVLAYTSLLALTATTTFRIYCCVLQAVQKTSDGHPFKDLLDTDLSVSPEKAQEMAVLATAHLNGAARELRRLFLVEDLVDSLKFGVSLWCLTYLGAWFNGMTLLIIGYIALFTLPKVYETNKAQIDANLELVSAKFQEITNKVKAAIPIGKKGDSEKDK